jgi:ATP-binding cassette, subfamily B, bacterial IrtA/YbtP
MKKEKNRSAFARLMEFAAPCRGKMTASIILAVLGVACSMVPYFAVANMVVKLLNGEKELSYYFIWCVVAAAGFLLKVIFASTSTTVSHTATYAVLKEIRKRLLSKLSRMPMGYILETPSGKLQSTIVDRVESLETSLAHLLPELTANILGPAAIIAYLFVLDWRMAFVSMITFPLGYLCIRRMGRNYPQRFQELVKRKHRMNTTVIEYVNGIEIIKAFNQSTNSYRKYSDAVTDHANYAVNWMRDCERFKAMGFSIWPAVLVTVLPFGCFFLMQGTLPISTFITVVILSLGIAGPLLTALDFTDSIAQVGSIVDEICELLDAPELVRPSENRKFDGLTIRLQDVSFSYGKGEKAQRILDGVSLTIKPGTVTALVGPSGSGKSTITKLIAGFWDVTSGSVSLGSIDIRELPQKQLMDKIAYVSQDNYLFNDTVRENIRMGKPHATDEEVENAAKASGCHDFIMKLENGYDTVVGGAGGHLSGGERQRIAIARAMLKSAPIVILDEATAYTDPESETVIQEAVARLTVGKTLIVIAHRLSTVTDSDKLVVVKDGHIEAEGTHEQLLRKCALYQSMWQAHIGAKDNIA